MTWSTCKVQITAGSKNDLEPVFCSFENFGLVFVSDKAQFEDVASSYVRKTATQYGAKSIKMNNYNKF